MLPKYTLLLIFVAIGYFLYRIHVLSTDTPSTTEISLPLRNDSNNGIVSTTEISLASQNDSNYETPFTDNLLLPPFMDFFQAYLIAPKYNLATCQIPKCMTTLSNAIFCLLFDKESFIKKNASMTETEWNTSACELKHKIMGGIENVDKILSKDSSMFVIVRDPVDRFLSGYIHICLNSEYCYGCKDDMACFINMQYERYRGFLDGKLDKKDVRSVDNHFAPQTWYCAFNTNFQRYKIIRHGLGDEIDRMADEMGEVFRANGVGEDDRAYIKSETLKGKTPHSTYFTPERKKYEAILRSSPELMEILIRMFYYDFIVFGFPLPSVERK